MNVSEKAGVVRVAVYVQPRASRTEIAGEHDGAVKIRLAAPPVDGAANEALERFLAKTLNVAPSQVKVVSGANSRKKSVAITGVSAAAVAAALQHRA